MKPSVGRVVHYQAYGTPGGEYKSVPRAAMITVAEWKGDAPATPSEYGDESNYRVRLAILNPDGLFFSPVLEYDAEASKPGTWRWPPRE